MSDDSMLVVFCSVRERSLVFLVVVCILVLVVRYSGCSFVGLLLNMFVTWLSIFWFWVVMWLRFGFMVVGVSWVCGSMIVVVVWLVDVWICLGE